MTFDNKLMCTSAEIKGSKSINNLGNVAAKMGGIGLTIPDPYAAAKKKLEEETDEYLKARAEESRHLPKEFKESGFFV